MNTQEAIECQKQLRVWIENMANELGVAEKATDKAVECVTVIPESGRTGFFVRKEELVSYRLENIKFDFKNALIPALELVTAINAPESIFNYVQLLIATALFVGKAIRKEYKKLDAFIIIALHEREKKGQEHINEEDFVKSVIEDYKKAEGKEVGSKEVYESINRLLETRVVCIDNGFISLIETVWGKR